MTPVARGRPRLPHKHSFWLLAAVLAFLFFPSSAPAPLYTVYEAEFRFSSITLTAIFAAYAIAVLATLLVTGRLSDHLGRQPVLMLALAVQVAGMLVFVIAQDVGLLYLGRILQGTSVGLATGTITAWLLDLQPPNNQRLGSLVGSIAPMIGIAGGAFLSGLLVQYGPDPLTLVFWVLAVVFIIAFAVMPTVPDVSVRTAGWFHSLRPRIGIPSRARASFAQLTPSLVAAWAMSGLYLSLGPSLVLSFLQSSNHFAGALVIVAFAGAAAIGSLLVRALDTRLTVIIGSVVLTLGVGVSLLTIMVNSDVGFYAAAALTGLGFGPVFSGSFRRLASLAPPDKRSSLLSSIFVVSYLPFGMAVVAAGVAITYYGLRDTTYGYGLVVMALAVLTTVEAYRSNGRDSTVVQPIPESERENIIPPLKT